MSWRGKSVAAHVGQRADDRKRRDTNMTEIKARQELEALRAREAFLARGGSIKRCPTMCAAGSMPWTDDREHAAERYRDARQERPALKGRE